MRIELPRREVPFTESELASFRKLDHQARLELARQDPEKFLQLAELTGSFLCPQEATDE